MKHDCEMQFLLPFIISNLPAQKDDEEAPTGRR